MRKLLEKMKVVSIIDDGDRALIKGSDTDYHIIARKDVVCNVGDTILYEPYGCNFGWFVGNYGEVED